MGCGCLADAWRNCWLNDRFITRQPPILVEFDHNRFEPMSSHVPPSSPPGAGMNLQSAVTLAALFLSPAAMLAGDATVSVTGVTWQRNLKAAAAESERSGKPILMQVTAEWCRYCHKMLGETFPDKKLAATVNGCFVPVVLDADENEKIVAAIGITAFPSTIIISPELDVIGRVQGFHTARSLEKKLAPYCKGKSRPGTEIKSVRNAADNAIEPIGKRVKSSQQARIPSPPVAAIGAVRGQPLVSKAAFDGLCLVSMLQNRKRQAGRSDYSTVFRNYRLQFASAENLKSFLAEPAHFWPLFDGRCPVAMIRGEKIQLGDVKMVAVYQGQLVFFKSLSHRNEFTQNPRGSFAQARALKTSGTNSE